MFSLPEPKPKIVAKLCTLIGCECLFASVTWIVWQRIEQKGQGGVTLKHQHHLEVVAEGMSLNDFPNALLRRIQLMRKRGQNRG